MIAIVMRVGWVVKVVISTGSAVEALQVSRKDIRILRQLINL